MDVIRAFRAALNSSLFQGREYFLRGSFVLGDLYVFSWGSSLCGGENWDQTLGSISLCRRWVPGRPGWWSLWLSQVRGLLLVHLPAFCLFVLSHFFLSLGKSDPLTSLPHCLLPDIQSGSPFCPASPEPQLVSSSCPSQFPLKSTMSSFLSFSNEFSLLLLHSSLISHLMFLSDLLLASCPFPLLINLFVLHVHGSRFHTPRLNVQLKRSGCSSVRALGLAGLGIEDGTIVVVVCLETSCLTLLG